MRLAVFRAKSDGLRTGERLIALGHIPILAPVIEIVPTGATVPDGTTGVLVFTSAQAPAALAAHSRGIGHLQDLPCWCVGSRTADAAQAAGFLHILQGPGDAASLAERLGQSHGGSLVTLVVGQDRKPIMETELRSHGIAFTAIEAYAAEAVAAWSPETIDALRGAEGALHYSRRSTRLAYERAVAAGLERDFKSWSHHCLSEDVASALRNRGVARLQVAARPGEEHLMKTLHGLRP